MRLRLLKFGIVTVVVAALGITAVRQRKANAALHLKAERLREQTAEIATLSRERERLAARQISPAELATLNESARDVARLRAEAAALHAQKENLATAPAQAPEPEAWSNSGRLTPLSTFRSAVWAVTQGDIDVLAGLISFDPAGRTLIDALFARLPPETQANHRSAEAVFATLLAARVPQDLTSAEVVASPLSQANEEILRLRLNRAHAPTKEANFHFKRDAEGWRIVVPTAVVEAYIGMLKGGLPTRPNPSALRGGAMTVGP